MSTEFGYTAVGASNFECENNGWKARTGTWGSYNFTCPGSGAQTVDYLAAYYVSGTAACGIAIYLTDGTQICEGSSKNAVAGTWVTWLPANLTWFHGYTGLTGGTTYYLAAAGEYGVYIAYDTGSTNDLTWNNDISPTAWSDPWYEDGTSNRRISVKCGVTAAGGSATPVIPEQNRGAFRGMFRRMSRI